MTSDGGNQLKLAKLKAWRINSSREKEMTIEEPGN